MAVVQLLLLFSPLLVFCSTQVVPGYEEHWWAHPMENFGSTPGSFYNQHPSNSPQETERPGSESDLSRFILKKFQPAKRFDEAQIQEALALDEETTTRWRDEVKRLRQLLAADFKLQTRLKRSDMEQGIGKEYITRLGKRSPTKFHRWQPLKVWRLWANPVAPHRRML